MNVRWGAWMAVAAAVLGLSGCGNRSTNPIGKSLLGRAPGQVVELPALPAVEGFSRFNGTLPLVHGGSLNLAIGRMHNIALASLLRFRVPADSLAIAAGGTGAADLEVRDFSFQVHELTDQQHGVLDVAVAQPEAAWDESTAMADSTTLKEIDFPSTPIAGAQVTVMTDSTIQVDLPASYVTDAISKDPAAASVEAMLRPGGTQDFFTWMISKDDSISGVVALHPVCTLTYAVNSQVHTYQTQPEADTYLTYRVNGGAPSNLLIVSGGLQYDTILRFDVPDSIPVGSTINVANLEFTVDATQSVFLHGFPDDFPLQFLRLDLATATGDTTFTAPYATDDVVYGLTSYSLNVSEPLVQSWISKAAPNHGLALHAGFVSPEAWVVIEDPKLKIVYTLPPQLN